VTDIEVHDDHENHRFVITVDGEPQGMAVYHVRGDRYFFVHTEVNPEFKGQGLGSKLARHVLDAMTDRGERIVPLCPFIAAYVKRHPAYLSLVDQEMVDRINTARAAQTS
jgi:uncharacterized protein